MAKQQGWRSGGREAMMRWRKEALARSRHRWRGRVSYSAKELSGGARWRSPASGHPRRALGVRAGRSSNEEVAKHLKLMGGRSSHPWGGEGP